MNTDASEDCTRMCLCECECRATGSQVSAGIYHAIYTSCYCCLDNCFAIGIKARGIDVSVAIDEHYNVPFQEIKGKRKGDRKYLFLSPSLINYSQRARKPHVLKLG